MKKISIVVPVYNVEKDLQRCVESIIKQSYPLWELWLINDGSTDSSADLCEKFAAYDNRIRVIHKENGGVSSARNVGIDNASGDYVIFVDSDDYLEENTLELMLKAAISANADVVLCGFIYRIMSENSTIRNVPQHPFVGDNDSFLANYFWEVYQKDLINPPWNKLIRRELLQENDLKFNINFSILEDIAFSIQVLEKSSKIVILQEALYNYCFKQQGNLVNKFHQNFFEALLNLDECLRQYFTIEDNTGLDDIRQQIFFQKTLAYLRKMYVESGYDNKAKYKELCRVCNNERLRICIKCCTSNEFSKKMVLFCMRKRMYGVLHLLYICS